MTEYEKENAELLEDILYSKFYKQFMLPSNKQEDSFLELNITATCNQKCEYCYLTKYGKDLYPLEIRGEHTIIENARILLDYYHENNYHPSKIDLFSGEIWGTSLSSKIFDLLIEKIDDGWVMNEIMIPSNMTFLLDEKKRKTIEKYIQLFKKRETKLMFSASVDGLPIEDDSRPMRTNSSNRTNQNFYDMLFDWCKKNQYGFHPMISSHSIDMSIINYDWWCDMIIKHNMNPYHAAMFLEVRNDEWTIDSIEHYLNFLNHVSNYEFNVLQNKNIYLFANTVIGAGKEIRCYSPLNIINEGAGFNCTIDKSIIVRLGDLAIGACHRTHYDKFQYGKYDIKDGKIIGVIANNVQLAHLVYNCNRNCLMKCGSCPISNMCLRGCLGAQYEANREILLPCNTVCQLFKARLIFLYYKYEKLGVWESICKNGSLTQKSIMGEMSSSVKALKKGEPNLWKYWKMVTDKII